MATTGLSHEWQSKVHKAKGMRSGFVRRKRDASIPGSELPASGVVWKVAFSPGEDEARTYSVEDGLGHDHQRHLVFRAGYGVEFLDRRFVGNINLLSNSFEDHDIVPRLEMN